MEQKHLTLTNFKERLQSVAKIETAIQSIPIQIQIKRYSQSQIMTLLSSMILELSTYFNLGKNMTTKQAAETAELLMEKYPVETLEDFAICFKKAKMGDYGKVYDRLDGHIIFGWFQMYLDEKYAVRERLIEEEKKQKAIEEAQIAAEIDQIRESYKNHRYERKRNGNTLSNSFIEELRNKYQVENKENHGSETGKRNGTDQQHPSQQDREAGADG